MLVSKFLTEFTSSHDILDHAGLSARFLKETGEAADWPHHSKAATAQTIKARGLGGTLTAEADTRLCYGYEVAEHLAHKHLGYASPAEGRGRRWADCVQALERAGK